MVNSCGVRDFVFKAAVLREKIPKIAVLRCFKFIAVRGIAD
jgi:hypothetical protein